ncbi:hypothetical protein ACFXCZ_28180 [Streptomyces sp. NPDC059396]|uniref:hypothetical protein n=1 Tax=Streptomyces sp. NPDC059396 TaxID=3346819 RepID=UPI00369749B6
MSNGHENGHEGRWPGATRGVAGAEAAAGRTELLDTWSGRIAEAVAPDEISFAGLTARVYADGGRGRRALLHSAPPAPGGAGGELATLLPTLWDALASSYHFLMAALASPATANAISGAALLLALEERGERRAGAGDPGAAGTGPAVGAGPAGPAPVAGGASAAASGSAGAPGSARTAGSAARATGAGSDAGADAPDVGAAPPSGGTAGPAAPAAGAVSGVGADSGAPTRAGTDAVGPGAGAAVGGLPPGVAGPAPGGGAAGPDALDPPGVPGSARTIGSAPVAGRVPPAVPVGSGVPVSDLAVIARAVVHVSSCLQDGGMERRVADRVAAEAVAALYAGRREGAGDFLGVLVGDQPPGAAGRTRRSAVRRLRRRLAARLAGRGSGE